MPDIPLTEPLQLRAGMTWSWKRTLPDFPAPTWTLAYQFKNATDQFVLTATASGSDQLINSPFATTAAIAPGSYGWTATVTFGVDRYQIGSGRMQVLPNTSTSGVLEERSTARQIVDSLEAQYLAYRSANIATTSGAVLSYTIGDRSMTFSDATQFEASIIQALNYWRNRVANEDQAQSIAQGLGNPRRLFIRFGPPS